MTNNTPHTPTDDGELREKLDNLNYDHHLDNFSDNLGQYKSKYSCICEHTFVTDGHDSREIGSTARFARHILDLQMNLIHQYGNTRAVKAVRKFADDTYPNVASAYVFNENVATASLLKDIELVLNQPQKENK